MSHNQKPTQADKQHEAISRLQSLYLHMRAWGLPEYADLSNKENRETFTQYVQTGALFNYVEECKHDVVQSGVQVSDKWLWPLCAAWIKEGEALPVGDRDMLGIIWSDMYLALIRLESNPLSSNNCNGCSYNMMFDFYAD